MSRRPARNKASTLNEEMIAWQKIWVHYNELLAESDISDIRRQNILKGIRCAEQEMSELTRAYESLSPAEQRRVTTSPSLPDSTMISQAPSLSRQGSGPYEVPGGVSGVSDEDRELQLAIALSLQEQEAQVNPSSIPPSIPSQAFAPVVSGMARFYQSQSSREPSL